jgi:hypothetical protein
MNPYLHVFAEIGDVFAKIEAVAKFVDGGVALFQLADGRRSEEPSGECVFAHAGAGEREKFEETAWAEEIEVGGVEAGAYVDSLSGLSRSLPAIFDTGETAAIELYRALGFGAAAKRSGVEDGDCDKKYGEGEQQPGREGVSMKGEPGRGQGCHDDQEAKVTEAKVDLLEARDLAFAAAKAFFVLG